MYPTLYQVGDGVGLHTYGLLIMVAIGLGCWLLGARVGRVGIDPDKLVPFYMIIIFGGLFGARLFYFLFSDWPAFSKNPLIFFQPSQGGLVFYGGIIVPTVLGMAWAARQGISALKLADAAAPSIMLGAAIGRIGCFFAGCCHGAACAAAQASVLLHMKGGEIVTVDGFPWIALTFEKGVGVGSIFDTPVYPTQLWDMTTSFLLFLLLSLEWKRFRRFDGQILATMLMTYPLIRSTIERFRGDTIRGEDVFLGLSSSQAISLPIMALGLVLFAWRWSKGLSPEVPIVDNEDDDDDDDDDGHE